jgi:hypothetical protein
MSILYAGGSKRILKHCLSTLKMHLITLQADVCQRLKSSSLFFGLLFISKSHIYIYKLLIGHQHGPTQPNSNVQHDKGLEVHHTQGSQCQPSSTSLGGQ